jgi:hypothetical protein
MPGEHDPEYIEARRILLDALKALGRHRKAVVLVGAQAIYLRVGEGELQVAPFTSDGDLALNPSVLDDEPILAEALQVLGRAGGQAGQCEPYQEFDCRPFNGVEYAQRCKDNGVGRTLCLPLSELRQLGATPLASLPMTLPRPLTDGGTTP